MRPSLIGLLWTWYRGLGMVGKLVYPVIFAVIYGASVLCAVGIYWLKTDMGYDVFHNGGWHAFARCLVTEIRDNP